MPFIRRHIKILKKRISEKRKFIQVIFGPRQVGKTTLVRQFLDNYKKPYTYVSADNESSTAWIEQVWQTARLKHREADSEEFLLVIDEIQKINNWSEVVKKYWDEDTAKGYNIKVIFLGSSSLLIDQGLSESLAGRYETIPLSHWSFNEMNEAFGISAEEYAYFGGYPGAVELIEDEKRWRAYLNDSLIEATISKDVLQMSNINKPKLLRNLFSLGCQFSSQILSFNKILGQLQDAGNTTTLSHYLDLLEKAGLLSGLQKFTTNPLKKRSSSPKFQVHNNALLTAQSPITFSEFKKNPELKGRIVESLIGTHLLNNSYGNYKVSHWKHSNYEVDFIVHTPKEKIAIEVKTTAVKKHSGIEEFQKKFNPDKLILISNDGISWEEFIKLNPADLF